MKLFLAVIIFISCCSSTFSQDLIDPPSLPHNFNDTSVYDRNFNHFIIGWNWGGPGRKMDEALHANYYHMQYHPENGSGDSSFTDTLHFGKNGRRVVSMYNADSLILIGQHPDTNQRINGQSILYKPVLTVDTSQWFIPRPYDRDGSVFGFKYKNKGVILDSSLHSNPDYEYFLLRKDSVSSPTVVLDSVWLDDQVRHYNHNAKTLSAKFNHTNGREWYITFNVKLKDTIPDTLLNQTILTLKMPYRRVHIDTSANPDSSTYSNGTIRFDGRPRIVSESIIDSLGTYRGQWKDSSAMNDTVINITGAMLKHPSNLIDSIITLSAYFICNGVTIAGQFVKNPLLAPDWFTNLYYDYITNLGVQITYHGKLDIGVNWVRLETPRARDVFHGRFDREVLFAVDTLAANLHRSNRANVRIHRFYASDEMHSPEWGINRYFNMLTDTLAAVETASKYARHFYHATGFQQIWSGMTIQMYATIAAPYIRKARADYLNGGRFIETFFYCNGFAGSFDSAFSSAGIFDSLQSGYETVLAGHDITLPAPDPDVFHNNFYYPDTNTNYIRGTQYAFEDILYRYYYLYPAMIYSEKPWWANQWIVPETWGFDSTVFPSFFQTINPESDRLATGEEVRLINGSSIILGTKDFWHG
ncbi:MAG: hypothetical protein IPM69_15430 [Ignavibacteria bacterium]|nr:hypothetical protein [Ignavibacteria bacterium]